MKQEKEWVIEAEHLSYTYDGNEKPALDDLNLKIVVHIRTPFRQRIRRFCVKI